MSERTDATGTSDGAAEATTTPPTPSRPRPTLRELMRRGLIVREGKRRGAVYRLP